MLHELAQSSSLSLFIIANVTVAELQLWRTVLFTLQLFYFTFSKQQYTYHTENFFLNPKEH